MAKIYSFETKQLLADLPTDMLSQPRNFSYGLNETANGQVIIIADCAESARLILKNVDTMPNKESLIAEAI